MKRRFRSYDYAEERTENGKLYLMTLRIRDYVLHTTYYAEYVVWCVFQDGSYFYDDQHVPVDDGSVSEELYSYAKNAFYWRIEQHAKEGIV